MLQKLQYSLLYRLIAQASTHLLGGKLRIEDEQAIRTNKQWTGYLKVRRGMCRPDSRSRGLEFAGLKIRLSRAIGQNRARIKYPGAVEFTPYKSELQEYEAG
jgi:hypothetical protein